MGIPSQNSLIREDSQDSIDDAEKGLYDSSVELTAPPPFAYIEQKRTTELDIDPRVLPTSPVHEGITPFSSVPELSLSWPPGHRATQATDVAKLETKVKKTEPKKRKISRWILFDLWFNTYRKFFTFVTVLNGVGIIMAALGKFPYAEDHLGALVLGNLLTAILMRNELWMRFLYMVAIYGLRGVGCSSSLAQNMAADKTCDLVGTLADQASSHICSAARRRYSFGMRAFRCGVRNYPDLADLECG